MPNQVLLDPNGVIRQIYEGKQTGATISQVVAETVAAIKTLQSTHKNTSVNLLVDVRAIGPQSLSARQTSARALKTLHYHKIAVFGGNRYLRHVANLVIMAAHKQSKVKHFEDEAAAAAWLRK